MRLLICGDRNWKDKELIREVIRIVKPAVIIEGEAKGADILARECGVEEGIPVKRFPANWTKYGRGAGPVRNQQMIDEGRPDLAIAFHKSIDKSKGTKDMLSRCAAQTIDHHLVVDSSCLEDVRALYGADEEE